MILYLSLALAVPLRSAAAADQTPPAAVGISTGNLSLAAMLDLARKNNPKIQAARHAWAAAADVPEEAAAFDDPTLNISHMLTNLQTKAGPMMDQFAISQKIPFWGKRALRGHAASSAAEVAHQAFRAKTLQVMDEAARAYYSLYFLDRAEAILEEQQNVLNSFFDSAEKKYAVGDAPESEALLAQVELAKVESGLVTTQEEEISAKARLNALLDRPPQALLGRPEEPGPPDFRWNEAALSRQALSQRPEILALQALRDKNAAERRLAIRNYFPDLTLGYQYTEIGGGTTNLPYDGQAVQALSFGVNLPIWIDKENAALKQSRENLTSTEYGLQDLVNETRYQVEDLSVKAQTLAQLYRLYRDTALPQAQAAMDSTGGAYAADRVSFESLLDSERSLLSLELAQERHRVDFEIALADLERVCGGPLSTQGEK